jgi:hypothetical protein
MFKDRLAKARNPVNGDKIAADNAAFAASPVGIRRAGNAALFNAQLEKGKEREALDAEMPAAEAELVAEGLDTSPAFWAGNQIRGAATGFTMSGRDQRIQQRALDRLRARAGVGYSPIEQMAGAPTDPLGAPGTMTGIGAAQGVDSYGSAAQFYTEVIRGNQLLLEEMRKLNAAKAGNQAPPLMNAAPAPPMRRP